MTAQGDLLWFPVGVPAPGGGVRVGETVHRLSADELAGWHRSLLGDAPERLVSVGAVLPVRLGTDAAVDAAQALRLLAWPGVLPPAHPAAPLLAECSLLRSLWSQCTVLAARGSSVTRWRPDAALYLTGVLAEVHLLLALGAASLDVVRPDRTTTWPPVAARRPGGSTGPPPHWPAHPGWGY